MEKVTIKDLYEAKSKYQKISEMYANGEVDILEVKQALSEYLVLEAMLNDQQQDNVINIDFKNKILVK